MLLTFGGICVGLSVIALFLSSVLSINTFALLTLASCFVGIMHIEGGIKYSSLTYLSVGILAFLLPVEKLNAIYYVCFFGYFPIIKSYIEKINKLPVELIIKTILYLAVSVLGVYAVWEIMGMPLSETLPMGAVVAIGVVAFHIYDYALSIFFNFYVKRIRTKIRR